MIFNENSGRDNVPRSFRKASVKLIDIGSNLAKTRPERFFRKKQMIWYLNDNYIWIY